MATIRPADVAERNACVMANDGLAYSIALRYRHGMADQDDLLQAARLGLILAVDGFDSGRGLKFSSYAGAVIRAEVFREHNAARQFRIHNTFRKLAASYRKAYLTMTVDGDEPDPESVLDAIGVVSPSTRKTVLAAVWSDLPPGEFCPNDIISPLPHGLDALVCDLIDRGEAAYLLISTDGGAPTNPRRAT